MTCCGQIQTRMSKDGVKMTEGFPLPLVQILYLNSLPNMIWILFVELTRCVQNSDKLNRIIKMVNLIKKREMFLVLPSEWNTKKILSLHEESKPQTFQLSAPAVYRALIMYELCNDLAHHIVSVLSRRELDCIIRRSEV